VDRVDTTGSGRGSTEHIPVVGEGRGGGRGEQGERRERGRRYGGG
jgi:hypothetical protein